MWFDKVAQGSSSSLIKEKTREHNGVLTLSTLPNSKRFWETTFLTLNLKGNPQKIIIQILTFVVSPKHRVWTPSPKKPRTSHIGEKGRELVSFLFQHVIYSNIISLED